MKNKIGLEMNYGIYNYIIVIYIILKNKILLDIYNAEVLFWNIKLLKIKLMVMIKIYMNIIKILNFMLYHNL